MDYLLENIHSAKWIRCPRATGYKVLCFSKCFETDKKISKAVLSVSALGVYTASLNGKELPVYPLAPGWTSYKTRVQYQSYDVTELISRENLLEICVGVGFRFHAPECENEEALGAGEIAVIASLCIRFDDGSERSVFTDESWLVQETKYRFSHMYDGECFDANFFPRSSYGAKALDIDTERLIPQEGELIAEHEILPVSGVIHTPKGETVLDFGQNMAGYVRFRVKGKKYAVCRFSHAEVLDSDGNFYTENLRTAKQSVTFICDGNEHVMHSRFSFQGFRYIRIDEWSGNIDPNDFVAVALYSDMERTGYFECSSPELNRLYENIIWGQKSNFIDIPTDCPQRDERLGWTGDAQVFCRCASYNYHVFKFFRKWLGDMRAGQRPYGSVPNIIPSRGWCSNTCGWADACTIIPWQMYLAYGDISILRENIDMMKKWVDYMRENFDEYVSPSRNHLGDWLSLDAAGKEKTGGTAKPFIACIYAYASTRNYIESCKVCGFPYEEYTEFLSRIKTEIYEKYMDSEAYEAASTDKRFHIKTQTHHAMLLYFGLYRDEGERKKLAHELNEMIAERGMSLTTGFLGTPYLLHALSENGYDETAYSLLLREEYPSWLYCVKKGATTIWERWDGIREDGSFQDASMNSFNHYAYGAVGDWIYSRMCGIKCDSPAFSHITLAPAATKRLSWAGASLKTKYGTIYSSWKNTEKGTVYSFKIPEGITARVILPDTDEEIGEGEHVYEVNNNGKK